LENGADANTRNFSGTSPLLLTLDENKSSFAKTLLLHGANPNDVFQDGTGRTALMKACKEGIEDAVEALLDHGADPLAQDRSGCTAQDYAATSKILSMVTFEPSSADYVLK
jgi:ankyrin repeat protein